VSERKKRKPQRVGDALSAFLGEHGLRERVEQAAVIPEWGRLVGSQIAAVTEPVSISRNGTLSVRVTTNAWMTELSLLEPQLLERLNAGAGRAPIRRIRWQLAG
jgi:predicted nucleic acid-binding Zn ribbon protein